MWRYEDWSPTAPNIPAGVLPEAQSWGPYVSQFFTLPAQQSASDAYTVLDSGQIMNLFKDIKNLNYTVFNGFRGGVCPYRYSQSCTYTVHEEDN